MGSQRVGHDSVTAHMEGVHEITFSLLSEFQKGRMEMSGNLEASGKQSLNKSLYTQF